MSEEPAKTFSSDDKPQKEIKKTRITVVETVYYQRLNENPESLESRFCRDLVSDDVDPYERHKKIGEEWEKLDCGWLPMNVGTICLKNEASKGRQGIPTEEERKDLAKKVIRLSFSKESVGDIVIYPDESVRICPYDVQNVWLRCSHGETRYHLFLVPR